MSNYKVIGIDMGHPLGCGANGIVSETDKNREIGKALIPILQSQGIKVVNCTVDERYSDDLARRVAIANNAKVDLYVSIHLDSFDDPGANGVTVFTTSTSGAKDIAKEVIDNVANSCGYTNRGLKFAEYYVIRHTKAPAFLVECGFVTNQGDCEMFNAEKIARAIAEGVLEKQIENLINQSQPNTENKEESRLLNKCKSNVVKKDSEGTYVYMLQSILVSLGYDPNGIDGNCGPGCVAAIKDYQRNNGLSVDGSCGPATWTHILTR